MKKVLFVASVVKIHIMVFHIPYLKLFKEMGYEVHVAAKNDYQHPSDLNIPYCDVFHDINFSRSPTSKDNLKAYMQLKEIINSNNFEIMHCHTPIAAAVARIATKNSKKENMKVFYTAHGFHFFKGAPLKNWLTFYPIEKYLSKYTDCLITINQEDFDLARNKFYAKKVEKINGIGLDLEKYAMVKIDKIYKRKNLGIPTNSFVVLSVGEINKNKNHQVIIKAISKLQDENIHYVICGDGPKKNELITLSQELGLEKQIHFLGYRHDINEICYAADIFAFPSHREGLGMAALEAMAVGLPIITSNIHGINDYSVNGLTGFSSNPKDINEFAKNIKILYENEELRKRMGSFNKEFVKKYSIQNILKQMKLIYHLGSK